MGIYCWNEYQYTTTGNMINGYSEPKEDTEDDIMIVKVRRADYELLSDLLKDCLNAHLENMYYPFSIDLVLI